MFVLKKAIVAANDQIARTKQPSLVVFVFLIVGKT